MGPLTSEQELAFIESQSGGPHYIPQDMADECIARYGRVPNNFRVGKLRIYKRKTPRSERPQGGAQWKREQKRRCL